MSVRFFLSISSPIVRTCENHSQFWHCTTTFTPIFWTYIVEREAKKWERNHSRHRFPTPRVGCSRLVVRCVYSVPIIFGVPMNLAPAAASMQARNWQPRNIHGMSPRNQPWKSDQLLLPVVFFFFEGCITTWLFLSLFLVYILFTQFFLLHPFWEPWDLSGVGQALAGTIKSKLTRNFRRQRSDPESKQSTGLRVCIVSASAGLVFVAEMTDTMRTTRSRMKVEQNFYVRTFVKVRPFLRVERRLHMLHELHSFGDLQVLCWSFVLLCPSTAMPLQMSLDSLARALAPWYVSFGHWGESLSWSFQWVLFSIV